MALVDNFDSYNDGDLNGQGGWSGSVAYDVQTSVVYSGPKAVSATIGSGGIRISKSITPETNGSQIAYQRVSTGSSGGSYFEIWSSGTRIAVFGFDAGASKIYLYYLTGGGLSNVEILYPYSADTWYKFELEWNSTNNQVRARINDGSWFGWYNCDAFGDIDTVSLFNSEGIITGYFDSFSDPNAPPPAVGKSQGLII